MAESEPRYCAECGDWIDDLRADARFCSSACKQRAYRKRKPVAAKSYDASAIVGRWFHWYPEDIRELLLRGEDAAAWKSWLPTAIIDEHAVPARDEGDIIHAGPVRLSGTIVHARGGPDGWHWRTMPLARFIQEAVELPAEP